jgi:hypothetical protein
MNALLRLAAFESLRYATMAWTYVVDLWDSFWDWYFWTPEVRPTRRYFLTPEGETSCPDALRVVPEQVVYVEEWLLNGTKKCVVRYPGDPIPEVWEFSPHVLSAKCPWIWVGDRNTEIDLTQTFAKFLVPGNRIRMDLVEKLIRVTEHTHLVYIEYGSFEEKEFPGEGLLIKANGPL